MLWRTPYPALEMSRFTPSFHTFFRGLEAHNDREWYAAHKADYEQHVRDPFKAFVTELIEACGTREEGYDTLAPKDCIFRIHRDTRFSKDKTPYKLHASAGISPGGKKSSDPGLYIHADAHKVVVGGGVYWVEKEDLYFLREKIARDPKAFNALMEAPAFASQYGPVLGERNVRLPKEFQAAAEQCPHLLNKQFFYMAELPSRTLLQEDIVDVVMAFFDAAAPMRAFLRSGLQAG